jgi:glycosyltransferase involved in cell wall biosynthesis
MVPGKPIKISRNKRRKILMKTSVIIPTYNRPNELKTCLLSILDQSRLPDEIIVIDDGELEDMPYREELQQRSIHCVFTKKLQKGPNYSRNLASKIAEGEIYVFFDDDVVLTPNYIEEIVRVYESGFDVKLGGVGGVDLNFKISGLLNILEYIYNIVFLISPIHPGDVTITGFSEHILPAEAYPFKTIIKAKVLPGGISSFHKRVFEQFLFAEDYPDNRCQGEDKDFSLRVSKKFNLYIQPTAQLYHYPSSIERPNKYQMGKNIILSAYRLFSRYIRKGKFDQILFYYSVFGYLIKFFFRYLVTFKKGEMDRIKGIIDAFKIIHQNNYI